MESNTPKTPAADPRITILQSQLERYVKVAVGVAGLHPDDVIPTPVDPCLFACLGEWIYEQEEETGRDEDYYIHSPDCPYRIAKELVG